MVQTSARIAISWMAALLFSLPQDLRLRTECMQNNEFNLIIISFIFFSAFRLFSYLRGTPLNPLKSIDRDPPYLHNAPQFAAHAGADDEGIKSPF